MWCGEIARCSHRGQKSLYIVPVGVETRNKFLDGRLANIPLRDRFQEAFVSRNVTVRVVFVSRDRCTCTADVLAFCTLARVARGVTGRHNAHRFAFRKISRLSGPAGYFWNNRGTPWGDRKTSRRVSVTNKRRSSCSPNVREMYREGRRVSIREKLELALTIFTKMKYSFKD